MKLRYLMFAFFLFNTIVILKAQEMSERVSVNRMQHFLVEKNSSDTLDFMGMYIIVDSLMEEKDFYFTALRSQDLQQVGTMANVTGGNWKGYSLLPHGVHFPNKPAIVALPYDKKLIPTGYTIEDINTYYFDETSKEWIALTKYEIDTVNQCVLSLTTHFTDFINAIVKEPEMPEQTVFTPYMIGDVKAPNPFGNIPLVSAPQSNSCGSTILQYPISLPQGRNGVNPEIVLNYNSSGGNDILGEGWSIPLMSISVSSKWGVPRYDIQHETEQYVLNGDELTLFKDDGSADTLLQNTNRLRQRQLDSTFFRQRRNERFDRIVRYGNSPSEYTWTVTDRLGTIYRYGQTIGTHVLDTNAVLRSPQGNIAYWALTEVEDQYGNTVHYYYKKADNNEYIVPDYINYTGYENTNGVYTVVFSYRNGRLDKSTNGRYGFLIKTPELLCNIAVFNKQNPLCGYIFDYAYGRSTRYKNVLKEIRKVDLTPELMARIDSIGGLKYDSIGRIEIEGGVAGLFCDYLYFHSATTEYSSITKFDYEPYPTTLFSSPEAVIPDIAISADNVSSLGIGSSINIGLGESSENSMALNAGYDFNFSTSNSNKILMDIDGDGLVDFVYHSHGDVFYRKQVIENGISSFLPAELIPSLSGILPRHSSQTVSASIGLSTIMYLNGNFPTSMDYSDIYFSDVNADGLPDLVTNDGVMFNSLDNFGHPVFQYIPELPNIGGEVPIVQTSNDCKTIIYDGHVSPDIMCDTILTYICSVDLSRSDLIEQYLDDVEYQVETDGTAAHVYSKTVKCEGRNDGNDTIVEAVKVWVAPHSGTLTITSDIKIVQDTSESRKQARTANGITLFIQRNSTILDSIPIGECDTTAHHLTTNCHVNQDDVLFFHLSSNSNQRFDNTECRYHIQYNNDMVEYDSQSDYVCGGETYFSAITAGVAIVDIPFTLGNMSGVTQLQVEVNGHGYQYFTFGAADSISDIIHLSPIVVNKGDSIRVIVETINNADWGKIDIRPCIGFIPNNVNGDTAFYHINVQRNDGHFIFHPNITLTNLFGPLYKGWGQFGYINRNGTGLIDVYRLIDVNSISMQNSQNIVNDNLRGDIASMMGTIDSSTIVTMDALQTIFSDYGVLYNPLIDYSDWQVMRSDPETYSYYSLSMNAKVGRSEMSNDAVVQRISSNMDIRIYDSSIPIYSSGLSDIKTIRKSSSSSIPSINLGASIPVSAEVPDASAGISLSWGTSKTQSDYMDLNGDGYPDIIGLSKIQYTMPWGGIGSPVDIKKIYTNTDFHLSKSQTYTIGASGGASGRFPLMQKSSNSTNKSSFTLDPNGSISNSRGGSECSQNYTDINGDGLPDVVLVDKNGVSVAFNVGYSFMDTVTSPWNDLAISSSRSLSSDMGGSISFFEQSLSLGECLSTSTDRSNVILSDINGDGLMDLVSRIGNNQFSVKYNVGNQFGDTLDTITGTFDRRLSFHSGTNASVTAGFSSGIKMAFTLRASFSDNESKTDVVLMDVNGDGFTDIVESNIHGITVRYNQASKTNLLRRVTNQGGTTIDIDYALSDSYRNSPHRMWQMTSVVTKDSSALLGDSVMRVEYEYGIPYYDRMEREFYGYDKVKEIANGSRVVVSKYDNRYYLTKGDMLSQSIEDIYGNIYVKRAFTHGYGNVRTLVSDAGLCDDANLMKIEECDMTTYFEPNTSSDSIVTNTCIHYGQFKNISNIEDYGDMSNSNDDVSVNVTYHPGNSINNFISLVSNVDVTGASSSRHAEFDYNEQGSMSLARRYNGGVFSDTEYDYDQYGMINRKTMPQNQHGQRMQYVFDYDSITHDHVVGITDSYGYQSGFKYDTLRWQPIEIVGINGGHMKYVYDSIGRLTDIVAPKELNSDIPYTIHYTYHPINYKKHTLHNQLINDESYSNSWIEMLQYDSTHPLLPLRTIDIYDGRGNIIQTKTTFTNDNVTQKLVSSGLQRKDLFGNVITQYYPSQDYSLDNYTFSYDTLASFVPTRVIYDAMNRPLVNIYPDGTQMKLAYWIKPDVGGTFRLVTKSTDANGVISEEYKTPQDWTVQSVVADSTSDKAVTRLFYNEFGERVRAIDPDSNITTYLYDEMGRLVERDHPDAGRTIFVYDNAGNLSESYNANQMVTSGGSVYKYNFGQLTFAMDRFFEDSVLYEYGAPGTNGAGQVVRTINSSGIEVMDYDCMGNVKSLTQFVTLPNESLPISIRTEWEYDSWGRLLKMNYPDGEAVNYGYNVAGQLSSVTGQSIYVERMLYDIFGHKIEVDYGNNTILTNTFDNMLRLSTSVLQSPVDGILKNISYAYDNVGNMVSQSNSRPMLSNGLGGESWQTYYYDNMRRLIHSEGANEDESLGYIQNMSYSPSGLIGSKSCDYTYQQDVYFYDALRVQPHALRKTIDAGHNRNTDFTYDANGNMQAYNVGEGNYLSYNFWNNDNRLLANVNTRACGYYGYGPDGVRRYKMTGKTVVMQSDAGLPVMDAIFDDYVLYPNAFFTATPSCYTKHYYAGAERVANRVVDGWFTLSHSVDSVETLVKPYFENCQTSCDDLMHLTFVDLPSFMNFTVSDSIMDISGHKILNEVKFPNLVKCGYYSNRNIVNDKVSRLGENVRPDTSLYFTHPDHLGSASWTTNSTGAAVQHIEYLPFGEIFINQRNSPYCERFTFTNKEIDDETNFTYVEQRYLSSRLGIWLSIDPLADKYPEVSPYVYCGNNPLVCVDPDGNDTLNVVYNEKNKEWSLDYAAGGNNVISYNNENVTFDSNDDVCMLRIYKDDVQCISAYFVSGLSDNPIYGFAVENPRYLLSCNIYSMSQNEVANSKIDNPPTKDSMNPKWQGYLIFSGGKKFHWGNSAKWSTGCVVAAGIGPLSVGENGLVSFDLEDSQNACYNLSLHFGAVKGNQKYQFYDSKRSKVVTRPALTWNNQKPNCRWSIKSILK